MDAQTLKNNIVYVQYLERIVKSKDHVSERLKNFLDMKRRLLSSPFVLVDGKIVQRNPSENLSAENEQLLRIGNIALSSLPEKVKVPNGLGVLVMSTDDQYEVLIDAPSKVGTAGGDFTVRIIMDKKSLNILKVELSA